MAEKFIRIFDRQHNILDELYNYNSLQYGWTLDDIDTATVKIALSDPKCTPGNMRFSNHIEITDEDIGTVWGGMIFGQSFSDAELTLNCLDYGAMLKYRRLRAKQYPVMQYGELMKQMIDDTQSARPDYPIGITGCSIAPGSLLTGRTVSGADFLFSKIKEFGDDANYDYGVDAGRNFNFWIRKGKDKPAYIMEYGGDADNIVSGPTLARDIMNFADSVYTESQSGTSTLTSAAEDSASESIYGLFEEVFSQSGDEISKSTLDIKTNGELQRVDMPADSITLKVKDGTLCPFSDIETGDRVTVNLIPYFDYSASVRILKMVHDESTGLRDITVGNILFRPQKPEKRLYRR